MVSNEGVGVCDELSMFAGSGAFEELRGEGVSREEGVFGGQTGTAWFDDEAGCLECEGVT